MTCVVREVRALPLSATLVDDIRQLLLGES